MILHCTLIPAAVEELLSAGVAGTVRIQAILAGFVACTWTRLP